MIIEWHSTGHIPTPAVKGLVNAVQLGPVHGKLVVDKVALQITLA